MAGEWGPGGNVLYMFQGIKRREKIFSEWEKTQKTNPKQNADGSCADSPLSALWQALLYFTGYHPSLPSYFSITPSLSSSVSWLIEQPLFQSPINLLLLITHFVLFLLLTIFIMIKMLYQFLSENIK